MDAVEERMGHRSNQNEEEAQVLSSKFVRLWLQRKVFFKSFFRTAQSDALSSDFKIKITGL